MIANRFDRAAYDQGRSAFVAGVTLREIAERLAAADGESAEAKEISFALGFADGALTALRAAMRVR